MNYAQSPLGDMIMSAGADELEFLCKFYIQKIDKFITSQKEPKAGSFDALNFAKSKLANLKQELNNSPSDFEKSRTLITALILSVDRNISLLMEMGFGRE